MSESVEGLCTSTDTFTVTPSYPLVAGQVKYWNSEETPMPTPFPTDENASYPHDYFYVTLYNGVTAIDTLIVEPRLDEDLFELMSYFEVDLGATYTSTQSIFDVFGCEGYHLAIWDGGLTYHPATYEAVLGANYTYNNWGGVNATDALAIQLMATNVEIQSGVYNFTWVGPNSDTPKYGYFSNPTANVNGSIVGSGITALDALTTNYRAVGLLDVFPYTGPGGGSGKFSPNFSVAGRMVPSLPKRSIILSSQGCLFAMKSPAALTMVGKSFSNAMRAAVVMGPNAHFFFCVMDSLPLRFVFALSFRFTGFRRIIFPS